MPRWSGRKPPANWALLTGSAADVHRLWKWFGVYWHEVPQKDRPRPRDWLTGKPHLFWYTDATGSLTSERIRLAGNTLLWAHGSLIFRLESALSLNQALRIASSLR